MLQKFFYLPILAGLFMTQNAKTPPGSLEQLVQKFYHFYSQYPQQKIYVQTDRPYYMAGDELYGKIYLINELAGAAPDSVQSKKIYVELIDANNTVVQRTIVNGLYTSLNFRFRLPDSIATGNYLLRAYTSWMLHYGNSPVFSTYLPISNKAESIKVSLAYKDSSLSTVVVKLTDTLKNAFSNQPARYQLLYQNHVVAEAQLKTDLQGKLLINVTAVPKQNRSEAALKIEMGSFEKLLFFPTDAIDVQFLPEGGNLVNDVENNVAFKAINAQGHGMAVEGFVEDTNKAVVARFKSLHLGMGQFRFTPTSHQAYTAVVRAGDKEYRFPLEPANDYGYQLSVVKRTKEALTVRMALGDSLYKKTKTSYLIANARSNIYFTSRGTGMYKVEIPLKDAPEGITQLTLFDEDMQPVSERLVYVSRPHAQVHLRADRDNYRKREKVTLQLDAEDREGKPLPGVYALSVTDDHVVKRDESAANIKTHLLLSPYLKGTIEEPGYYFRSDDSTTQSDLDLVMLTHGWSRFTWQNIVDGKITTQPYIKDSSLAISGTLLNSKGTPLRQCLVHLFSKTDNAFIGVDTTDEQGRFSFPGIDFTDSTSFFIQVKNAKGRNEDATVVIDPQPFPLHNVERPYIPGELPEELQTGMAYYARFMYDSLKEAHTFFTLKEVAVKTTKRKVNYDESKRLSQLSFILPPGLIERYRNMTLYDLMHMVPGATFTGSGVTFFGPSTMGGDSSGGTTFPLVIVDGVEMAGGGDINLHDVDFIEVLRGAEASMYGVRGGNGVIVVNTRQGKDAPVYFTQNGIKTLQVPGYHVEREFYTPRYETEESRLSPKKDDRITIYWNGDVYTDDKGNARISFYTADARTTYTLTLEGVAQNGAYIHQTVDINRTE